MDDDRWLSIPEVARELAPVWGITDAGARRKLYNALDFGHLRGRRFLGSIRVTRRDIERWRHGGGSKNVWQLRGLRRVGAHVQS